MYYLAWFILLLAGVSDAQRHRIPNQLVGAFLLVVLMNIYQQPDIAWLHHLKGFAFTFAACFGLYLIRAMAGGDVKLLAVIGLWLGAETMSQAAPYIVLAGGVIGIFYVAQHMASSVESVGQQIKAYAVQRVTPGWKSKQPLVIPFAPAIVLGLAYYFYIN